MTLALTGLLKACHDLLPGLSEALRRWVSLVIVAHIAGSHRCIHRLLLHWRRLHYLLVLLANLLFQYSQQHGLLVLVVLHG